MSAAKETAGIQDRSRPDGAGAKNLDSLQNSPYTPIVEVDENGLVRLLIGKWVYRTLFRIHAQSHTPIFRVKEGPPGFKYDEGIVVRGIQSSARQVDVTIPGAKAEIKDGHIVLTIPITE